MKTIATLLLSALLTCSGIARDVTLGWDQDYDSITSFRIERQVGPVWAMLGVVTGVEGNRVAREIRFPDFPDIQTSVRCIAVNAFGESPPSEVLTIEATPGAPRALRFTLTPKTASVDISAPGKGISIEQSTDLSVWREIAKGWGYVVAAVAMDRPRAFFRARLRAA